MSNQPKFSETELDEGFQDFLRRKGLRESAELAKLPMGTLAVKHYPDNLPISQLSWVSSRYSQANDDKDAEEASQTKEMQRLVSIATSRASCQKINR